MLYVARCRYLQYKLWTKSIHGASMIKARYSHPFAQLLPAPESDVRYVSGRKRCPRTPLRSFDDIVSVYRSTLGWDISTHLVADTRLQIYLNTSWYISCGTNSDISCYLIKVYSGLITKQVKSGQQSHLNIKKPIRVSTLWSCNGSFPW